MTKKKNTRTRAKRGSKANHYFTKDHEDAIVKYAMTRDNVIRTDLYVKWIQPAFDEMVDKIVYTYKFTTLPNIDELRDECKIWLTTILDKYDPNKGSKAFSYFSVITKNWFIHEVKKTAKRTRQEVDFDDSTKSENSRICYPINFVENSLGSKGLKSAGPHPNSIIFLTCDAYGIMPPLAKMTKKQAMYHFISGYTAKMAGTETGVTEPVAAFSPCYGGPFLTLHPLRYAELLEQKLNEYNSSVFLVNTGWSGSSATSGSSRIDLKKTKHIINLITDGNLDFNKSVYDKFFNLEIPLDVYGLENDFLVPHHSWNNLEEYFSTGNMLTRLFNNNFEKFLIQDPDILAAGPKTDLST